MAVGNERSVSVHRVDVMVIGGGAAGIAAARAARSAGARVALVRENAAASAMGAGWITGERVPAWVVETGLRKPGNYRFVSTAGTVVEGVSGLASLLDLGAVPMDRPVGVVDVIAGASWSADLVARSLAEVHAGGARIVAITSEFPRGDNCARVARALDTEGLTDGLGTVLKRVAEGFGALLFPPVLGLMRDDVATRWSHATGVMCGETGGAPGDPTAIRTARALASALPGDVAVFTARASVSRDASDEGAWVVRAGEHTVKARAVVLATGGLASGGIVFDGGFTEPLLDAPTWRPAEGAGAHTLVLARGSAERGADPSRMFAPDDAGVAMATSVGVRVDEHMRVLAADGRTVFAHGLFAAGAVIAGRRGAYGAGTGDALSDGDEAGKRAAVS